MKKTASVKILFLFLWTAFTIVPASAELLKTFQDAGSGLSFQYPSRFKPGTFQVEPMPSEATQAGLESPFKNAVVLVEPAVLNGASVDRIPVGEVPVIWLEILTGQRARFSTALFREGDRLDLGGKTTYRLPGFPGPYGDAGFYYLVPLSRDRLLEVGGHRKYFRKMDPENPSQHLSTDYDRVIEALIPTLKESR